MRGLPIIIGCMVALMATACGPSEETIQATVDAKIQQTIAAIATATPQPTAVTFPTPLPTATPVTFPEPLPTATPPPTAEPITFPTPLATATPQPTATPIRLPTALPTATPQPVADFNTIHDNVWPSVFYIGASSGSGTGWLVERGLILTAFRVVGSDQNVIVRQAGNPSFEATVVAVDRLRDMVLLSFNVTSAQLPSGAVPLLLGSISTADVAKPLMALGYASVGVFADGSVGSVPAKVGVLSQLVDFGQLGDRLSVDTSVGPGDSGGPVIDGSGRVVGMI